MKYKITVTLRNGEGLTADQVYLREGDEVQALLCTAQQLNLNRDESDRGLYRADAAVIKIELLP